MKKQTLQTSATLRKEHIDFLDNISKEARFSGGKKLSRTVILRSLLELIRKLNIDVSNVHSEEELEHRFIEAFKQYGMK